MMGRILLLLVVMVGVATAATTYSAEDYQTAFTQWMTTHNRAYSASEFATRFAAFKVNLDFIAEFNTRNASFTVALNRFSDLNVEEFRALLLKPFPKPTRSLHEDAEFTGEGVKIPRSDLDWRTKGAVNAIKDQGQCGSCWTFSAAASMESANQIATGTLPSLSEQNLLDCVTQYSKGCNGGSYEEAFQYIISKGGIGTEAAYPYAGAQGSCRYDASQSGGLINSYSKVTANDESALMAAVTNQPVSVGIQADLASFQQYKSGVYKDSACTSANINHAVVAIGYGTDSTYGDYWLIRNSWGTGWGEKGYVRMQRGTNMCGVAAQGMFPKRTGTATTSTTKAPSGTTTTTKAPSGTTTTTKAPSSTTTTTAPSSRSGWVFQDALASGWTLGYSGSVTGLTAAAAGVSASVASGGAIMFSSNPALSTSAFTTLTFSIKTSTATVVGYGTGSSSQTVTTTSSFKSVSTPLSSLGSPSSVTYVAFANPGSRTVTITVDNIKFV